MPRLPSAAPAGAQLHLTLASTETSVRHLITAVGSACLKGDTFTDRDQ